MDETTKAGYAGELVTWTDHEGQNHIGVVVAEAADGSLTVGVLPTVTVHASTVEVMPYGAE